MAQIQLKDIWVIYRLKFLIKGKAIWENFWALKSIDLHISPGETLGIIGENGAGKTTLLKIIAGMLKPDRGQVEVSGRVAGLLDIGAGFQPELTGRENVEFNLSLAGIDPAKLPDVIGRVIEFADIGRFIDAPVKCYSQGMFVRLAFAAAIFVDPEILVVDDILAVGDEFFQRKCIKKIFELKDAGTMIVVVTHDMAMLQKLCQRAVLIQDGRIVKDDIVEKVIPFYSQLVGPRQAVAVLKRGPLSVVFNHGRMFFNWNDTVLTPNTGACGGFFVNGMCYHSFQADWDVVLEDPTSLVAYGRMYQLDLIQVWRLKITDNLELRWDVEIKSNAPVDIRDGYVNLLLNKEYSRWFSMFHEAAFPEIDEVARGWSFLSEDNMSHVCVGVGAPEHMKAAFPSIIFESLDGWNKTQAQVLNSDYITASRVLQYRISGAQDQTAPTNAFSWFSGKISFNVADERKFLESVASQNMLRLKKTCLVFREGRCEIVNDTSPSLSRSSFMLYVSCGHGRYVSTSARSQIVKREKGMMLVAISWPALPLAYELELVCGENQEVRFKIVLKVFEKVVIENQIFEFSFPSEYAHWLQGDCWQEFPSQFADYEIDMTQKCLTANIVGVLSRDNLFPDIVIRMNEAPNNFVKVFNGTVFTRTRNIRVYQVVPESKALFIPGEYVFVEGDISLGAIKKDAPALKKARVWQDQLSFVFDDGCGRIFWNDAEITKGLGVYTSLRLDGVWHDSGSSAIWMLEYADHAVIKVKGKMIRLALDQYWEICIEGGNVIKVDGWVMAENKTTIDRFQVNLMLSEQYDRWRADGVMGEIADFKVGIDDDWETVYSLSHGALADVNVLGLEASVDQPTKPSVAMQPCTSELTEACRVVNSDVYHRGRLLQYVTQGRLHLEPGKKMHFKAKYYVGGRGYGH